MIGARLGDAGRDRADADFGHQLDRNIGLLVDVLEIVDELGEIFDGIDVVMRRRADEAHAGRRMTGLGDDPVDLVAGQLAAFAGLGALRDLDLQLIGIDQVFGGDAEAAGRDLLDGRAHGVARAIGQGLVAVGFLAAFTGVGLAANAVHRLGEGGVGFAADRAEAHGAGDEALDDVDRRFDLVERHGVAERLDVEQVADGEIAVFARVHASGKAVVAVLRGFGRFVLGADGVLQVGHDVRAPGMLLAADAVHVFAADIERLAQHDVVAEGVAVAAHGFLGDFGEADAFDGGGGAEEEALDEIGA